MEPTVFCLVIPLTLNICSIPIDFDPFLHSIRQERSISVNTGNAAGEADGKIVNTAQTDKQLIINIETRLLPQFNVYLDSLQQQPKMQCTSNDGETNGKEKKRIFTCVAISNLCCPSTLTCTCSDQPDPSSTTVVTDSPLNPSSETDLVPGNPECENLCAVCADDSTPFIPGNPKCIEMCALCAGISPTTTQCPQPSTTEMIPGSPKCQDLCAICVDDPPTALVPGSPKCQELCAICANTPTPTSSIPTTPSCPTPTSTDMTPGSPKCEDLCAICVDDPPTALVPGSPKCQELCAICANTPTPTSSIPTTPSCPTPTSTDMTPGSPKCQELCAICAVEPPTALVPGSPKCQELCAMCVETPPPPISTIPDIPTPEPKCISCNTLCQMCIRPTLYDRKKRSLRYDYYNPIVTNIKSADSNDNYYDDKQSNENKQNFESKFIGALMASPHKKRPTKNPNLVPGSTLCQQLCIDCAATTTTVDPLLVPWSTECKNLCCYCKYKWPTSAPLHPHLIPGSEECQKLCKDCAIVTPSPQPGSIACNTMCAICTLEPTIKPVSEEHAYSCVDCDALADEQTSPVLQSDAVKITRNNCTHSSTINELF